MLPKIRAATAVSSLALFFAACSPSGSATAASEPAAPVATAQIMEAQPASMSAPAPASATDMAGMDHSAHAVTPADAPKPGVAPAPAPVVAPVEDKQPVNAAAVTAHTLPIDKIRNFKLADQNGKLYELYKMTDAKAIVLTMHTKGCPIGQQLQPDFKDMQAKYEAKGVKFLMLNSNLYDTPKAIAEEVKSFGSTIPVLKDTDQSVGEPLGVERATETLVIQPGTWKVLYQGPINDRVTYGRARAKAEHQYVGDVVDAMLAGKTVTPSYIAPEGCILVFDNRKS
ncbi:MAG: redoxin domain-containing protein [Hyphomonadaceae bacterium]